MNYALTALFLVPFWGLAYVALSRLFRPETADGQTRWQRYTDWIVENLDSMFIPVSATLVRRGLVVLLVVAALAGYLMPSALPGFDRLAVEEAMALNRQGKYKQARDLLLDLRAATSPLVHNELGVAQMGLGSYDDAMQSFRKALEYEPLYAKAHANLSMAYGFVDNAERQSFEEVRAREVSKYQLDTENIYNLGSSRLAGQLLRVAVALVMVWLAWKLPAAGIALLRWRRRSRYEEQLPDALLMASNGLKAGFSLLQALDVVAREMTAPVSQEFTLVLREHRLGADLDEALERLARRVQGMDTRIFVNSLLILRETGGNLTTMFDTLAETMRERKRVHQKIRTLTAEGETQAYILAILPVVLGLIMYKLNPETTGLLFTTPLGWMIVALMALMETVGLVWMLKTVRVRI